MSHEVPRVEPERIDTHADAAVARLPLQLQGPEREGLIRARAARWQALEFVLFDVLTGRYLLHAFGVRLDWWGNILGEAREGLNDAAYKRFIAARVLARHSSGTPDAVSHVLAVATDALAIRVYLLPYLTCRFEYLVPVPLTSTERRKVVRLLRFASPKMATVQVVEGSEAPFGTTGGFSQTRGFSVGLLATRIDDDV